MATTRNLETEFDTFKADIDKLRLDISNLSKALGDTARSEVNTQAGRAKGAARDAADRLDEATLRARLKAREGATAIENQIEERPFTSVMVAFGIGLLLGKVMDR
ncbi:hypothetical protein [Inquilinus sp. CAU 1745]|uniref:DUF883 family protein n=1 Tax=Inquilinus sp. CAU 1745 TaxID=3140369 RepID=UPI00325ADE36